MAAPLSPPRLLPSGDSAITVEFSRKIDDEANRRVLALDRTLASEPIAGVTETVPTYRSLLIHCDPTQIDLPKHVKSGLMDAVDVLEGVRGIAFTHFQSEDVVRHPLVGRIVDAYAARRAESEDRGRS